MLCTRSTTDPALFPAQQPAQRIEVMGLFNRVICALPLPLFISPIALDFAPYKYYTLSTELACFLLSISILLLDTIIGDFLL